MHVILATLFCIRQTGHRLVDPFECLVGLRRVILVWVHFKALFLVCLFKLSLGGLLSYTKHLIVVFTLEYIRGNFCFFGSEFFWFRLWYDPFLYSWLLC